MIMSTVMEKYGFITFPNFRPEFYYGHPPGRYLAPNHPICFALFRIAPPCTQHFFTCREARTRSTQNWGVHVPPSHVFFQPKMVLRNRQKLKQKNEDQKFIHQLIDQKKIWSWPREIFGFLSDQRVGWKRKEGLYQHSTSRHLGFSDGSTSFQPVSKGNLGNPPLASIDPCHLWQSDGAQDFPNIHGALSIIVPLFFQY